MDQLNAIEGIGPEIAQSVFSWFQDERNLELVAKLRKAGLRMKDEPAPPQPEGPLSGKTIIITGGLASLSRDEATRAAIQAGARVASSVSKKTSFVVVGENPGSKYDKALELGIETVDEKEFLKRLS